MLPSPSGSQETASEKDKNLKCTSGNKRKKLFLNKYTSSLHRRKPVPTVSVPLSDIRDCVVLCQRLEMSLNRPVELNKSCHDPALLENFKQLKVKLIRLKNPSPRRRKTICSKLYFKEKCWESKKHNGEINTIINSELTQDGDSCQPCDNSEKMTTNNKNEVIVESNSLVDLNEEVRINNLVKIEKFKEEENSDNGVLCDKEKLKTGDEEGNNLDDGIESSKEFNEAIRCPHGNLSIEEAERKLVPVRVWEILSQYFPSAPKFAHDSTPCHQCQNLASKDEFVKQQYYESALNQKKTLSDLFHLRNRPQIGKAEGLIYILHKQYFYQPWIAFLKAASRRDNSATVDPPVSLKVETLLCIHGLLHYSPQFDDDLDRLVLVTEQEWEALLNMYTADFSVTVAADFTTLPELCESCFATRIEDEQKEKFNYDRAKIYIRMVPSASLQDDRENEVTKKRRLDDGSTSPIPPELKKAMKSIVPATAVAGDVRRSGRTRKVPGQKDVSFFVSSNFTMRELKQKITNHLAVAPFDQHLFTQDGKELQGDYNTLSSLGILPNSTLLLQVDEPKESFDDVMEECSTHNEREVGFEGTGLLHAY